MRRFHLSRALGGLGLALVLSATGLHAVPPPAGVAPVSTPVGGFGIDGDLIANQPASGAGDWLYLSNVPGAGESVLGLNGIPLNPNMSFHYLDAAGVSGADNIFQGGKWFDDPKDWSWTMGKSSSKTDINNVQLHLTTDADGHIWAVISADRLSVSGASYIDFEFLQNTLVKNSNHTFDSEGPDGGRTANDLLLSLAFTDGGSVADFFTWRWAPNGLGGFAYVDATAALPVGKVFVALNSASTAVPYGAFGQTNYLPNAFAEAAIDLTALLGNLDPCLSISAKTIMVKTKASSSSSATIEDFIDPIQYTLRIGPAADAGPDQTVCDQGDTNVFQLKGKASRGIFPIQSTAWSVVNGDVTIDSPTSLDAVARLTSASATLRLTVIQANGCVVTDDVLLTVAALPEAEIAGPSTEDPVCPNAQFQLRGPDGMTSYAWSITGNGSLVGATNQQVVTVLAGNNCAEAITVTLTVGNERCTDAASVEYMVIDVAAPVLALPQDLTLECPADTNTNATGTATASDGCGGLVSIHYSDVVNELPCGGTKRIARTWTATDACGNRTSGVQDIVVEDTTPPGLQLPTNLTLEYPANTQPAATGMATGTDACGQVTVTFADAVTNGCGSTAGILRTWTGTDECGNRTSGVQSIVVQDTTAPVLQVPVNLTLEYPADTSPNATGVATATDASGSFTIAYSDVMTAGCGSAQTIARTWTATDECGNKTSGVQSIVVQDSTAPELVIPQSLTLECPADTSTNATGVATATDASDSLTITYSDVVNEQPCGGTKSIARTWTVVDACGNRSSGVQSIVVEDTTPPGLQLPTNLALEYPANTQPASTGTATGTDACGQVTITFADAVTNGCGSTVGILRTWTATDECGNSSSATQSIVVQDTTAPELVIPQSLTLECPADTSTNATGVATATDASDSLTITYSDVVNEQPCGGTKSIARTWTVVDACGNRSSGVQRIVVEDTTPPGLQLPTNLTLEYPADTGTNATGVAMGSDACGQVAINYSDAVTNGCGSTAGILRTWTATDECGNQTSGVQRIVVQDTTPPSLRVPASLTLEYPANTGTNATGVATATDANGSLTITYSDVVSTNCGLTRTIQRLWTATDRCGNTTNGLQTIAVVDTQKPKITSPAITVQCPGDVPAVYANLAAFLAAGGTATDNSDPELTFSLTSDSGLVGSCPGTVTRVYRVTDDCGNFAESTQRIIVDDTIAPTLVSPPGLTVQCTDSLDPMNTGYATATDNCDANVSITYNDAQVPSTYSLNWYASDPVNGSAPYLPTYLKLAPASLPRPTTGRAMDPLRNAVAYGPTAGQLDALTSLGGEPLALGQVVPFQAVIEVSGGPGPERGTIEFTASWSTHTTSNDEFGYDKNYKVYCAFVDAADIGSIDPHLNAKVDSFSSTIINTGSIDEKIQGTFRVSGLDTGDRVVVEVWVVLMCTQPDQVGGTIASDLVSAQKVLTPPQPITIGTKTISIGNLNRLNQLPPPQSQPPLPPLPPQPPLEPGFIVSVIDRTWTATDDCGNQSTRTQRFTIRDAAAPSIMVPANVVLEYPADTRTNVTGVAVAQDNCSSTAVTYSDTVSNGCGDTKVVSRLWTASDEWGNTTNVAQTITVADTTAPALQVPANVTLELPANTATDATGLATATDANGSPTVSYSDAVTAGCGGARTIARTWTAVDACGNRTTGLQTINVVDTTAPALQVPANVTLEYPAETSTNATGVATATDASGSFTIAYIDVVTEECGSAQTIARTWTATDACGNSASGLQTIAVVDTTAPVFEPMTDRILLMGEPVVFDEPILADRSGAQSQSDPLPQAGVLSTTTNAFDSTVEITRTWAASDACGNTSSVSQTLAFMPPPTLEILSLGSGKVLLRWAEQPAGFHLEYCLNPNGGAWAPAPGIPTVIERMNYLEVNANSSMCLFRLAKNGLEGTARGLPSTVQE